MYASDFSSGAATARELLNEDARSTARTFHLRPTPWRVGTSLRRGIYEKAVSTGAAGAASLGSLGLSDLAMYEGRYDAAVKALRSGADADRKAEMSSAEAAKLVALAQAHAAAGRASDSQTAAAQALALGDDDSIGCRSDDSTSPRKGD